MKTKSSKILLQKKLRKKSFVRAYKEIEYLVKIGAAISETREKVGLSQNELAKLLNTTQSVVSRIENGNQNLTLKMLKQIANVLNSHLEIALQPQKLAA
jgi:ribosome-binding protein aMBF1 (putative translation factor)